MLDIMVINEEAVDTCHNDATCSCSAQSRFEAKVNSVKFKVASAGHKAD